MQFTQLDNLLWSAGFVGHVVLSATLLQRGRWRSFPIFTSLMAYEAVVSVVLFLVSQYGDAHSYLVCYWSLAGLDYCFQIALLVEIAHCVFPHSAPWVTVWRTRIIALSIPGVAIATALCVTLSPVGMSGLQLWDERVTLFTSLLTCELCLAISLNANRLRLQWRDHVWAIGSGMALWASTALVGDMLRALWGWNTNVFFSDRVRMFVYLADLMYWMWALRRPEKSVRAIHMESASGSLMLSHSAAVQ